MRRARALGSRRAGSGLLDDVGELVRQEPPSGRRRGRVGACAEKEVLAFRVQELPALVPLHVFMFPRTVALMLIGATAWRAQLFRTWI